MPNSPNGREASSLEVVCAEMNHAMNGYTGHDVNKEACVLLVLIFTEDTRDKKAKKRQD